ncbi:MAG: tetratricopeptide repeat protein [candidate division Zixibacteria bacterium]|nr:tetratricopeptide repeat protein [candidate division Zixibacteria bacterium]
MDGCTDKRLGTRLYAYELRLLAENERQEFEIHLLECPYCHARALKFADAARLIRDDADLQTLAAEAADHETIAPISARSSRLTTIIRSLAVAAAALLILVLKPWQIEISPTQEAVAAENRLAVMYFDNIADPTDSMRLGEITTYLLTTDLSESQYLDIVSTQRLYDIMRLMGHTGTKVVDRDIATHVAEKASARWMLLGSILQMEPGLVVRGQLVDVATGRLLASQHISGEPEETIFDLVDRFTIQVKEDLALPRGAIQEPDPRIASVTTHSPLAYRYYVDGVEYEAQFLSDDAEASFRAAIAHDSTFAMAYYYLAGLTVGEEQDSMIARATAFADNASQKEQLYIRSRKAGVDGSFRTATEALFQVIDRYPDEKTAYYLIATYKSAMGYSQEAIHYLKKAIALDLLYKQAYNHLAYVYNSLDKVDESVEALNRYAALVPDEPNPYDSRGEIYAYNGRLDDAIESFQEALKRKPDFLPSLRSLGDMYVFKGDYENARMCYEQFIEHSDSENRTSARLSLAYIPARQGQMDRLLDLMTELIVIDSLDMVASGERVNQKSMYVMVARAYAARGEYGPALDALDRAIDYNTMEYPDDKRTYRGTRALYLAAAGRIEEAQQVADSLRDESAELGRHPGVYWYAAGAIAFYLGDYESCQEYFKKASWSTESLSAQLFLARAYLETGTFDEAENILEKQLSRYQRYRLQYGPMNVQLHYYLGQVYEKTERPEKAADEYRTLLTVWQEADPYFVEIDDARQRLARLTSNL